MSAPYRWTTTASFTEGVAGSRGVGGIGFGGNRPILGSGRLLVVGLVGRVRNAEPTRSSFSTSASPSGRMRQLPQAPAHRPRRAGRPRRRPAPACAAGVGGFVAPPRVSPRRILGGRCRFAGLGRSRCLRTGMHHALEGARTALVELQPGRERLDAHLEVLHLDAEPRHLEHQVVQHLEAQRSSSSRTLSRAANSTNCRLEVSTTCDRGPKCWFSRLEVLDRCLASPRTLVSWASLIWLCQCSTWIIGFGLKNSFSSGLSTFRVAQQLPDRAPRRVVDGLGVEGVVVEPWGFGRRFERGTARTACTSGRRGAPPFPRAVAGNAARDPTATPSGVEELLELDGRQLADLLLGVVDAALLADPRPDLPHDLLDVDRVGANVEIGHDSGDSAAAERRQPTGYVGAAASRPFRRLGGPRRAGSSATRERAVNDDHDRERPRAPRRRAAAGARSISAGLPPPSLRCTRYR